MRWVDTDLNNTQSLFQGTSRQVADITFQSMHKYTFTHDINRQIYSKCYWKSIKCQISFSIMKQILTQIYFPDTVIAF